MAKIIPFPKQGLHTAEHQGKEDDPPSEALFEEYEALLLKTLCSEVLLKLLLADAE